MISERIFLNARVCMVTFRTGTAMQRATLTFRSMVMSSWRSGKLRVVCFNTQLCRTARDRILTNHSRVSQLVIGLRQNDLLAISSFAIFTVFHAFTDCTSPRCRISPLIVYSLMRASPCNRVTTTRQQTVCAVAHHDRRCHGNINKLLAASIVT